MRSKRAVVDLNAVEARFAGWRMDGAEDIGEMGLALCAEVRALREENAKVREAALWLCSEMAGSDVARPERSALLRALGRLDAESKDGGR